MTYIPHHVLTKESEKASLKENQKEDVVTQACAEVEKCKCYTAASHLNVSKWEDLPREPQQIYSLIAFFLKKAIHKYFKCYSQCFGEY